jgi:hypothetical protein
VNTLLKPLAIAALLIATPVAANAQWELGPSRQTIPGGSKEPCWSAANPVRCDGSYRPHNPIVFELFRRDPAAPQSYWNNR